MMPLYLYFCEQSLLVIQYFYNKFSISLHQKLCHFVTCIKFSRRRSLSDSWKANTGTSVVEEIALTDRYECFLCSKIKQTFLILEKSVGTTELHYSTKKREHSFSILKAFLVRHSSEYETSDNDRKANRSI